VVSVATQAWNDLGLLVASTATAALFVVPMFSELARRFLASRFLCFLGFISYPLYLVHQNLVTGLAIKLHGYLPGYPGYLYPLPFIVGVVVFAYFLASSEPHMKRALAWFFPAKILGYDVRR
jgi:peptidoglycan/LPS O-acetylase OafA/YrhL